MSKAKGGRFMDDFENSSDDSEKEVKPVVRKNRFVAISSSEESSENSSDDSSCDSDSESGASSDSSSNSGSSSDSDSSSSGSSSEGSSSDEDDSEDWNMSEASSDEELDETTTREQSMKRWLKDSDESDFETTATKKTAATGAAAGWEVASMSYQHTQSRRWEDIEENV